MTTDQLFHLKYKLYKKTIGRGSFSTVYLGKDKFNNLVAVKQISLSKIKSDQTSKFLRELDISMKLNHPNIVKCYDIFKTEKHWYIVSEYCESGTLQNILLSLDKYDHQQREIIVKKILNDLKKAIYYLISNNIIHRDLKPSNILLKKVSTRENIISFSIKLADFGFARYFSNEIENSDVGYNNMIDTICGSPIYMAPELLINFKYHMKADLWSFGVIMYELLYGENPYCFPKNIPELRKLIIEKEIIYPQYFTSDCIDLMKSLLSTDPENRISWQKFFSHKWFSDADTFDTNLFQYISEDIVLDIPQENVIKFDPINSINTNNDVLSDQDFEIINIDENSLHEYYTYKECSTNSLIKILSNSFRNFFY